MEKTLNNDQATLKDKQLLGALRAFRRGEFTTRLPDDLTGTDGEIAEAFNDVVAKNQALTNEVARLRNAFGRDGRTSERAKLDNVSGGWRQGLDSINELIGDTVQQTAEISRVVSAVAQGDLSQTMVLEVDGRPLKGDFLRGAKTINTMVDRLGVVSSEVTRVAREVGTEGKLGGQAKVKGVAGTWKDLTDNVNAMATNLTGQVRNIAEVTTAVARGDLSKKITVDVKGEILELKDTINTMVDQLNSFASEVTRVAREVGTEGQLGGQAQVEGVAGTWKDLTDNVNSMAGNLTVQLRDVSKVATAIASGDLTQKITVDVQGEILQIKDVINVMVDQLSSFASEVTRVAREVGTEGKLGGQAKVKGVAGTWKDLTDNVNAMATNLTGQVRNIAEVTTAVARGDLSKKITVDVKGEILELKDTINTMVDQLNSFASEVTRVAREVGTEGQLGGQAQVEGVAGTWKDLTDNVNSMAGNLTVQLRDVSKVATAIASGDLTQKITVDVQGEILQIKDVINVMVDQLSSFASEVTRVAREVGTEGQLGGQAQVEGVGGTWKDLTDNVNAMATNLTGQVRNIAEVTTAVARGDLSKKITVDVKGEILELKDTINTMVDQLSSFASEVTRVAREVGTEGQLGGQAKVEGVAGTWKDLTDNVNSMATNLTNQVRGIAQVVTAVANGNMKRKLTVDAKGEIAELAETINGMIDTLATFGDQVTDVAREVGIEGKLGGQAKVPGASGLWRDLTDNVNQLADNLTTQVRAIAEVATAVAAGDLTRSIAVQASGEVAALKDNINQMIGNLRETTEYNEEQDWLKTNLARFTRMMQGERDLVTVCNLVMSEIAPLIEVQHGVLYVLRHDTDSASGEEEKVFELLASYALNERKHISNTVRMREGLVGQCAFERQRILLTNVPGDYVRITSGLGEAPPLNIVVLPVIFEDEVLAVIELASFTRFTQVHLSILDQLVESIGIVLNTIAASMRTEELLKQSQILTRELQTQQEELTSTNDRLKQQAMTMRQSEDLLKSQQDELRTKNEELEEKAVQLQAEKRQVEAINREVETARSSLEEKAEQLALTSKYKSEFLANMSHELRTPLNSLLILSKLLADNTRGNLNPKQIEQAGTIHSAGSDLLRMINDILDLSKIESGTVELDIDEMNFDQFALQTERTFREVAEQKKIDFTIEIDPDLPASMTTDAMRLQQIINNLLSNAFKFTEDGSVALTVSALQTQDDSGAHNDLNGESVSFTITDTGIGISPQQQQIVFEAFQQADGTTSRRYGGTGLGLSISRELASLLGGQIRLTSQVGAGSSFTLILPLEREASDQVRHAREPGLSEERLDAPLRAHRAPPQRSTLLAQPSPVVQPFASTDRPLIMIVEDDPIFARILGEIAEEQGFAHIVVVHGRDVMAAIRQYRPAALSLDIQLPDIDGWALLEMLKNDESTQHLPIHVISVVEDQKRLRTHMGAVEYSGKPASREELEVVFSRLMELVERKKRSVLLVRFEKAHSAGEDLLADLSDVDVAVETPRKAAAALQDTRFDAIVLAGSKITRDFAGVLEALPSSKLNARTPLVVELAEKPNRAQAELLGNAAAATFVASEDEAAIHDELVRALRLPIDSLPRDTRDAMAAVRQREPALAGLKVAVIDDDVRNIFSLTALLEEQGIEVVQAENGLDGIELLKSNGDIFAALIDIMMPGMDGYETMRRIRKSKRFQNLPLIAVTAKAMPEDREKCFAVGASDYLSKPVDNDELIAVLRTWMKRSGENGKDSE